MIPDEPVPPRVVLSRWALVRPMPLDKDGRTAWVAELEGALLQDTKTQVDRMRDWGWPDEVISAYCEAADEYYASRVRSAVESALLDDWLVRS